MKLISIVGTRPNFTKLAPLAKALKKTKHKHLILHTGQHYDNNMSQLFFDELGIPRPDYGLDSGSGCLTDRLADMLVPVSDILCSELPDLVLVYGDCNSTLAGALASVQNKFPIAHIESGIRNNSLLIPEMLNRIIVDRISSINLCSCEQDILNLKRENINGHLVGDLMKDQLMQQLGDNNPVTGNYHVLTMHRPRNVDDEKILMKILRAIVRSDKTVYWPTHPRARKMLKNIKGLGNKIRIVEPKGYPEFIEMMRHADKIITDSGGVQKEAYWLKKPCIVLYDETPWPQIFETGNMVLVSGEGDRLEWALNEFQGTMRFPNIFGDGHAADKMIDVIDNYDLSTAFDFEV